MNDKVSIITPVYNAEKYLSETYQSIKSQSYTNWEWICVDDKSTDNSVELLRTLSKIDSRIILILNKQNKGPALSRNTGIEKSKGRYIAFLDSDDLWFESKLSLQIGKMRIKNSAISHTSYAFVDNQAKDINSLHLVGMNDITYNQLLKYCNMNCSSVVYDTMKTGKVYMPDIKKRQDYACWLSILRSGAESTGIEDVLVHTRIIKDSVSYNKIGVIKYQWNVLRNIEKLSLLYTIYCISIWAFHGIHKYYIRKV